MSWEEILKKVPLTPNERKQVEELVRFRNIDEQEAEKVVRRKSGKLEGRKRIEEIDEDRWKGRFVKKDMSYCVCSGPNKTKGFTCKAHCRSKEMRKAPRIPRKKGQHRGSKSHSDLYTDENPKGTIKNLGFKDVKTAKESVNRIKRSGRSHNHKTQAALAMEQRAKVAGKTQEAAVYRQFIEQQKKKTKNSKNKSR